MSACGEPEVWMQADHLSLALNPQPCVCLALPCCWTVSSAPKAFLLIITVFPIPASVSSGYESYLLISPSVCLQSCCFPVPSVQWDLRPLRCLHLSVFEGRTKWLCWLAKFGAVVSPVGSHSKFSHYNYCHCYSTSPLPHILSVYIGCYFQCCIYAKFLPVAYISQALPPEIPPVSVDSEGAHI